MNARPARRGSLLADSLRCLLSLVALTALLVGLPAVLYVAGRAVLPLGLEGLGSVTDLFTQQDTGAVALLVLVAVGWAGWASFALSVLLEIPAQLRGRTAPRLRGLRWNQRMAAGLVGGVLVLLPTAGGALAAEPAPTTAPSSHTAVAAASATPGTQDATKTTTAASQRSDASHPTYTVRDTRPADSLWSIAEQRLGDGERWTEIADLNEGRTMADGRVFHAAQPIQPGWVLYLPGKTEAAQPEEESVTVHRGDTLWGIAESSLGDPTRYPDLVEANEGRAMDEAGHRLTDPAMLLPGWKVVIPAQGEDESENRPGQQPGAGTPGSQTPDAEKPGSEKPGSPAPESASPSPSQTAREPGADASRTAEPSATPSQTASPSAEPSAEASATPEAGPTREGGAPPAATPRQPTAAQTPPSEASASAEASPSQDRTAPVAEDNRADDAVALATWGGLLATGLVSVLALKRILQRRNRRTGESIALPRAFATPTSPAAAAAAQPGSQTEAATPAHSPHAAPSDLADLERRLRATENPEGVALIDRALRTLAHRLAAEGRPLPELVALRLTPTTLELWLDAPAEPVAPFTTPTLPTRWILPADAPGLLDPDACREVCAPYPALATLGRDPEGALVLADLEALGVLLLPSESGDVLPVARALAAELATTPWSDDLGVLVAGLDAGITAIEEGFGRLAPAADARDAISQVRDWARTVRGALADAGADSLHTARTRPYGADAWTPRIALCAHDVPADLSDAVRGLLDAPACAALVVAADDTVMPGAVRLPGLSGGTVTLAGTEIHLVPQHIADADYAALLGLFGITAAASRPPAEEPQPLSEEEEGELARQPETLIRLLGAPRITGTAQEIAPAAAGRLTEVAAWIALHPGASADSLTEALWPGGVSAAYRTAQLSALRRWLGAEISTGDGYRLTGDIGTDWHRFQLLVRRGDLAAALDLVEGRPLDGTPPRRYTWADPIRQDMTTAVVDASVRLAERLLAEGDAAAARAVADRGLKVDPADELLHRLAIKAAAAMGDRQAVEEYVAQVDFVVQSLGTDMQPETSELLSDLDRRPALP
ncbi:LysM peptidoglycan-binding domain-containing protein [Streptomyces sp. ISL-22]|uniref:BTAD domain-containing putative transcriptional regulator n=1 Tax=unclassified Streptomyces TaxID=2593676 RepID=UPI001BEB797A|nr:MULTISPECIES: BTAD domain-containing putative transcriptional regulator [unclassified Streptomyces]MBT2418023.1 LysM peptidoglycan-binding domain-containing protein [Streptomyces sp. ISL-24]MBT2432302.1 LysM peptidoglycan-binding domain-containing protein [Streptomyces sp. ISL-22]